MIFFKYLNLRVPEEFLLMDGDKVVSHYKVNLINLKDSGWIFVITHVNGKKITCRISSPHKIRYFLPDKLVNRTLIECSLEKFHNMKVFI